MNQRTLTIVLVVSLVANVFILGGLGGALFMWKRATAERPMNGIGRPARLRQAAEALNPEDRRMLRQALRAAVQELRPEIRKARDARRESGEILVQPVLNRLALEAALARARASDILVRARLEQTVVDVAARLSPAERQALAQALIRAANRPSGERSARLDTDQQ
ncbi:Uncharacterized membrane protein [Sphingomonas sp. YR710]|uniref:periplasmic heavy metal sensor n=1 Tax=Sphingomonas sp. YR710 TaxID=1882773 RepID=UPI0008893953|nr:periplasmic heavy metal sensor [Sphingomonas sp. YR710]SDD65408.1 Uncharacterized membrane protein [Sphingomonas sp. YR710]